MNGSVLVEKSSFKILGLILSSKMDFKMICRTVGPPLGASLEHLAIVKMGPG